MKAPSSSFVRLPKGHSWSPGNSGRDVAEEATGSFKELPPRCRSRSTYALLKSHPFGAARCAVSLPRAVLLCCRACGHYASLPLVWLLLTDAALTRRGCAFRRG